VSYDAPPPPGEPTPESGATPPVPPPYEPPAPPADAPAPPPPPPPPPPAAAYPPPPAGYGAPTPGAPVPYAEWIQRVLAYLVDYVPILVIYIIGIILVAILGSIASGLGLLAYLATVVAAIGYWVLNRVMLAGKTGQSLGKRVIGLKLIGEASGQPIGAGNALVRDIAHILDGICFIGYLWPNWDAKRQTFADKIMTTIVIPGDKQDVATAFKATLPNA